jgi:hypothetical protein
VEEVFPVVDSAVAAGARFEESLASQNQEPGNTTISEGWKHKSKVKCGGQECPPPHIQCFLRKMYLRASGQNSAKALLPIFPAISCRDRDEVCLRKDSAWEKIA